MKNAQPQPAPAFRITNFLPQRQAAFPGEIARFLSRENVPFFENEVSETTLGHVFLVGRESPFPEILERLFVCKNAGERVVVVWAEPENLPTKTRWELLCAETDDLLEWETCEKSRETLACRLRRWSKIEQMMAHPFVLENMVGSGSRWRSVLRQLLEAAVFSQSPVLVLGESGTGKESAARLVHQFDVRPFKQGLVLLDCASIAPELSGSEFFGHEKGAFTNAVNSRVGAFEEGHNGTVFLDEIGELPRRLQGELLRVMQEGSFKRLGSNTWKSANFRLVSATNRDLLAESRQNDFRNDLFHRISTWVFTLPPLAERREDIPELVRFFLRQLIPDEKRRPAVDPLLMRYLQTRDYPGNIRELKQVVTRLANRYADSGWLGFGELPPCDRPVFSKTGQQPFDCPHFVNAMRRALSAGFCHREIVNQVSCVLKDISIADSGGNLQLAAERLNVSDRTLQLFMKNQA